MSKFVTTCCSVHCMDPLDDLQYYHCTEWPKAPKKGEISKINSKVKISMTFRWLGKRAQFLGSNYNNRSGERKYTQAITQPRRLLKGIKSDSKRSAMKHMLKHK